MPVMKNEDSSMILNECLEALGLVLEYNNDDHPLHQHALRVGEGCVIIGQKIGMNPKILQRMYYAGILHDIGKLLIAAHLPDSYGVINKLSEKMSISTAEAETKVIGTTHAGIGAYLLGLWGLPDSILDATAFHHMPNSKPANGLHTTAIVHIADAMAKSGDDIHQPEGTIDGLDYDVLQEVGHLSSITHWKAICAEYVTSNNKE